MGWPCDFDAAAGGIPIGRPSDSNRWQLIASHPRDCAEFFRCFMHAFCDVYLGWRPGARSQHDPSCLFGRVDAFFFKFETNQRGELHAHGDIWQACMAPHRIRAALSDPASRVNLLSFMESIMCQWLPSPDLWGESLDVLPTCCPDGVMTPGLRSMCEDLGSALTAAVVPFKARQVPLSGPHACTAAELLRFVALVVLEVNFHHHKPTCVHYCPGVVAGDCNCRARFPRCLNWASQVDEATDCVHLKRYGKWLVPYTRSLMLAQPCNHMVYFTCEIGRWVRDLELWRQRNPGLALDDPAAPRLPLLEDLAADAADYALKYATKAETTEGSMAILASAILLAQRQALERYVERMQPPAAAATAEVAKGMAASASTYGPAPPAGAPGAPTLPQISTASQVRPRHPVCEGLC
ncbi:hypothetical protein GPECTOR_6g814 [Gonium pectorale]|uniref:Helitron helicase-like domain-containing protein n=1 Tax=Gonium pectorale TaxID=33097 RepID=A0A150GVI8_GONPE|nr:hypothetical protein GPECTOR_6g814 [Gonium pectorale]|eukprot:KXZ53896.1 hypothetical protein GPECTOR_6g814 [Gonium pectorale]